MRAAGKAGLPSALAGAHVAPVVPLASAPFPEDASLARLLLSRATFGERPGDRDHLLGVGAERWLDAQLSPERVDDRRVESRLAALDTLRLDPGELMELYPRASREERQAMSRAREPVAREDTVSGGRARMRDGPGTVLRHLSEARLVRAVHSERQLAEVMTDFWLNHFNVYARKNRNTLLSLPSYERDAIRPHALGRFEDLLLATASHPAMLFYLDNWVNTKEGFDPRAAFREATGGPSRRGPRRRRQRTLETRGEAGGEPARKLGINENYARELLELHTLGAEGGYDQDDVVAVARAFTGWSVVGPELAGVAERMRARRVDVRGLGRIPPTGSFLFNSHAHDERPKSLMGRPMSGDGMDEGRRVLAWLSQHPQTARFVCTKLARRFVAEHPSDGMVDELSSTFLKTNGDIRAVLRALFESPRFVEEGARSSLTKTPFELVVSSLRFTGAEVEGPGLARALTNLGMPLYMCQPPTGYDDGSEAWLSAGGVLSRARFARAFASGSLPGVRLPRGLADPGDLAIALASPEFQRQ